MAMPPSSEALSPQASANTSAYGKCATSPLKSRRCATGSSPATEQGRILRPQNGDGASRRSAGGRKHHIVGQLGGGNLHYKVWLDKYAAPEAETLRNAVMDAVEDGALDLGGMFSADLRRRASRACTVGEACMGTTELLRDRAADRAVARLVSAIFFGRTNSARGVRLVAAGCAVSLPLILSFGFRAHLLSLLLSGKPETLQSSWKCFLIMDDGMY